MNRRSLLGSILLAVAPRPLTWSLWVSAARASDRNWRHGVSSFGDLKYSAGFSHFEYVNADAPKGGAARQIAYGTFDNFNKVVAGAKGSLAAGIDLVYETLLVSSLDEISTAYGLLAEAVSFPPDFSSATYRLREQAKWHDGTPVAPDDVVFSFEAFKKYSPELSANYRHVTKAEKTGDHEVTFTVDAPGNRELPRIVGELTVLPRKWWEDADKDGKKRNIGETTLEPPLGSGPYRIKDFSAGRHIVYAYDFPAVSDRRVLLEEFAIRNIGMRK